MSGPYQQLPDQRSAAQYAQQNPYQQPPPPGYAVAPPVSNYGTGYAQPPPGYAPPAGYVPPQQQYGHQPGAPYAPQPMVYAPPQQQVVYMQPQQVAYPAAPAKAARVPVAVAAQQEPGAKRGARLPDVVLPPPPPARPHSGDMGEDVGRFDAAPNACRDWVWALIFVLHVIGIIVVAGVMYHMYHSALANRDDDAGEQDASNGRQIKVDGRAAAIVGVVVLISFIMSAAWLGAFKRWARQIVWAALISSPVLLVACGVLFLYLNLVIGAVICFVCAALNVLFIYLCRRRVAFTAAILSIVAQVLQLFPASTVLAFAAIGVQILWIVVWVVAAAGIMHSFRNQEKTVVYPDGTTHTQGNSDSQIGGVWFMLVLSFFWTMQVIKNVCHVTTAGVIATWYFLAPDNMPPNPTWASFKRASWTSFGSVCLGSLIIAVVKTLRFMVQQARGADHPVARCIVLCLLDCLERAVRYFNIYAFTQIAIYGKPYCAAAADTMDLLESSGITALINDDMTGSTLFFASLMSGLVGAMVAGGMAYNREPMWGLWALIGGLIALSIVLIAMEVVGAAVVAFFVCYAEDPAALQSSKPALYASFQEATHRRVKRPQAAPRQRM